MSTRFSLKLAAPTSAPVLIDRPTTLANLERALSTYQLIALAAPAGWGKTTVLAQWVHRSGLPTAWYTLDPTDRDPHIFLDYLLHAVRPFIPRAEDLLAELPSLPPARLNELFRAAALGIAESNTDFVLVLDDFHVLEEDDSLLLPGTNLVVDFLATLAAYAPRCRLVLVSRTVPTLSGMARMVTQERATVFDYTVLQWSISDVQTLAAQRYNLSLPDEIAERLVIKMDGWVTGIVLSLSRAAHTGDLSMLETPVDAGHLSAFFAEQIVAPLALDLQRFLEETSVLDALSPQSCDQLREQHDSRFFLDEIRRRGLFITQRSGWLSYHSLFRDFLRAQLARDPQRERRLLQRAGDIYRAEEQIERALECYLAARQPEQALDLLRGAVQPLRRHSRQTTLLACFERITRVQPLPPELMLSQALVYSDLALWDQADLMLGAAETLGNTDVRSDARILSARIALLKDDLELARSLLAEEPPASSAPRVQLRYHTAMGQLHGLSGNVDAAQAAFERAYSLLPHVNIQDEPNLQADLHDNLGWVYGTQGNNRQALRHLQRAEACWQALGDQGRRALTLNNIGTIETQQGRYAEARAALETGLEIARTTRLRREENGLSQSLAELEMYEGHLPEALLSFYGTYERATAIDKPKQRAAAAVGALLVSALQGDLAEFQRWQRVARALELERWPQLHAAALLAEAYASLQQLPADPMRLRDLADRIEPLAPRMKNYEQLCLGLLQAHQTLLQKGWDAARPLWQEWEQRSAQYGQDLLHVVTRLHQPLMRAAASSSALARDLLHDTSPPAPRWQVTALGDFACNVDGKTCQIAPLYRALLLRLLDAGPGGIAVDRLWEDVWGNDVLSMPALHQALRRLRVQSQLDVAARDGICAIWTSWEQISYDVQQLEELLRTRQGEKQVEQAIDLYRGDFFEGAPLGAAHWADKRRLQLQSAFLDHLEYAARQTEQNDPKRAMHYYQRILQIDGCREEVATHLMRLAGRFGNHALVAATFKQLERALSQIGIQPNPSTTTLYLQTQ
ncbi:MAG TPA: tetratricopeptide repeat protein [Roseiflexaceae bacterium]|nr:tetratricopeptide repeat protein [Roseiflexaceae bacterium]